MSNSTIFKSLFESLFAFYEKTHLFAYPLPTYYLTIQLRELITMTYCEIRQVYYQGDSW